MVNKTMTNKYEITFTLDDICFSDYWGGHGHTYDNKTLACIVIAIPVNYTENVKEIIDSIIEDSNMRELDFINVDESDKDTQTEINQYVTNTILETAIREQLQNNIKDTDLFFDEQPIANNEDIEELPYLYGYFHITKSE